MPSLPPLNPLRAFDAAAEHLNFTRGAEALHVTQSAVSHQVKLLEEFLGRPLFRRSREGLSLTPSGESLFPVVHAAFDSIAAAVEQIRGEGGEELLTIGVRPFFSFNWLAPRLVQFCNTHPRIGIRLRHTHDVLDVVHSSIDLSIAFGDGNWPHHAVDFLMPCELTPVCNPVIVERLGRPFELADLRQQTLLHEANYEKWPQWLALAGIADIKPKHDVFIDDTNVRFQAAINGQGFALGSPRLLAEEITRGRLTIPFDIKLERFSYYIVGPKDRAFSRKTSAFRTWLLQQAAPAA